MEVHLTAESLTPQKVRTLASAGPMGLVLLTTFDAPSRVIAHQDISCLGPPWWKVLVVGFCFWLTMALRPCLYPSLSSIYGNPQEPMIRKRYEGMAEGKLWGFKWVKWQRVWVGRAAHGAQTGFHFFALNHIKPSFFCDWSMWPVLRITELVLRYLRCALAVLALWELSMKKAPALEGFDYSNRGQTPAVPRHLVSQPSIDIRLAILVHILMLILVLDWYVFRNYAYSLNL